MGAIQISDGGGIDFQLSRVDVVQFWEVWGMSEPRAPWTTSGLPKRGDPITVPIEVGTVTVIVNNVRFQRSLTTAIAPGDDIVKYAEVWAVYASTNVGGSAGLRRTSRLRSRAYEYVKVPGWFSFTPQGGTPQWVAVPDEKRVVRQRVVTELIRTRQVSGLAEQDVADFDFDNAGGWVNRGTETNPRFYIYDGTELETSATNQQVVRVKYHTLSGLPLYPLGSIPGYDLEVPQLPPLCHYTESVQSVSTDVPIIGISVPDESYPPATIPQWDQ